MSRKTKAALPSTSASAPGLTASSPPVRSAAQMLVAVAAIVAIAVAGYYIWDEIASSRQFAAVSEALNRFDYDTATDRLNAYLARRPADTAAHLLASQTARRRNDFAMANQELRLAKQSDALQEAVGVEADLARIHQGDLTSVERFVGFCEKQPPGPQTALALEAIFEGSIRGIRPVLAKWAADRWLSTRPAPLDQAMGHVWLGRLHEYAQDSAAALIEYRKAAELAPEFRFARVRLTETLIREAPGEATSHLDWLLTGDPGDRTVRLLQRASGERSGKPEEAAALLDEMLKAFPNDVPTLLERGRVALELHDDAEAERRLRRAFELAPQQRDTRAALVDCLRQAGKPFEAEEHRRALQEIDDRLQKAIDAMSLGKSKTP